MSGSRRMFGIQRIRAHRMGTWEPKDARKGKLYIYISSQEGTDISAGISHSSRIEAFTNSHHEQEEKRTSRTQLHYPRASHAAPLL